MRYIFCLGMYRSCSTWQYEVISHFAETYRNGLRLGFIEGIHYQDIPNLGQPPERLKILKAHDVDPLFVRELERGWALPIYAYRDIRDVVFSFMHKAGLEFDDVIEQKFLPKVLANDSYWRGLPNVFCQRYEDVIADQNRAVAELTIPLGLDLTPEEIHQVANAYSWEANLQRTREVKLKAEAAGLDLADRAHIFAHDPHTLLHWNHLREGKRKGWSELATPDQREILATYCADWLIANGYESDTAWVTSDPTQQFTTGDTLRADPAHPLAHPSYWFRRVWPIIARSWNRSTHSSV